MLDRTVELAVSDLPQHPRDLLYRTYSPLMEFLSLNAAKSSSRIQRLLENIRESEVRNEVRISFHKKWFHREGEQIEEEKEGEEQEQGNRRREFDRCYPYLEY